MLGLSAGKTQGRGSDISATLWWPGLVDHGREYKRRVPRLVEPRVDGIRWRLVRGFMRKRVRSDVVAIDQAIQRGWMGSESTGKCTLGSANASSLLALLETRVPLRLSKRRSVRPVR